MKRVPIFFCILFLFVFAAKSQTTVPVQYQQLVNKLIEQAPVGKPQKIESPNRLLEFAKSMLGIRYRSASSSPSRGFDCSGFVNYVFSNFGFKVPAFIQGICSQRRIQKTGRCKNRRCDLIYRNQQQIKNPGTCGNHLLHKWR